MSHDKFENIACLRAERYTDTDLVGSLGNRIGDNSVDAYCSQYQRNRGKKAKQQHIESTLRDRFIKEIIHLSDLWNILLLVDLFYCFAHLCHKTCRIVGCSLKYQ